MTSWHVHGKPSLCLYKDIISSENLHHSSFRSFHKMADNAALAAIPICCVLGSKLLVKCTAVNIRFLCTIFKEGSQNIFLWLTDTGNSLKTSLAWVALPVARLLPD